MTRHRHPTHESEPEPADNMLPATAQAAEDKPPPAPPPAPEPQTPTQDASHVANVVAATGTRVSTMQAAKLTLTNSAWAASDLATCRTAAKNADIAYHRAIITSAVANQQPAPTGSMQALLALGVTV
jgi:hypothetical protein